MVDGVIQQGTVVGRVFVILEYKNVAMKLKSQTRINPTRANASKGNVQMYRATSQNMIKIR